jgi:oxygen-independent coproporphyrinogen-3 oxidase
VTDRDEGQAAYIESLLREIAFWKDRPGQPLVSIYFGGGTPSQLKPALWERLMEVLRRSFAWDSRIEITAEGNPESLTPELLACWKRIGINRLSVGVQSFEDRFLALLDRRHDRAGALASFGRIREAGFSNWSLDLIYGLPGQSLADWESDLEAALALSPPHLSFYNLILHPNLPVTRKALEVLTPDHDDLQAEMFLSAVETLEESGYQVYELSNASHPGYQCRHNLLYWSGGEWIGMGMSAASCFREAYFSNPSSWEAYMKTWDTVPNSLPVERNHPSREAALMDLIMLRLRLRAGLALDDLKGFLGSTLPESFHKLKRDLAQSGCLRESPDRLSLSPKGWLVHSEITTRLFKSLSD